MSAPGQFRVAIRGPRPPFGAVADHIWGDGVDVDSDGNSVSADDRHWTELTLVNRERPDEHVDIDPVSDTPLILEVKASTSILARRVAEFLRDKTDGQIID